MRREAHGGITVNNGAELDMNQALGSGEQSWAGSINGRGPKRS